MALSELAPLNDFGYFTSLISDPLVKCRTGLLSPETCKHYDRMANIV